jgi:hypothetical protein
MEEKKLDKFSSILHQSQNRDKCRLALLKLGEDIKSTKVGQTTFQFCRSRLGRPTRKLGQSHWAWDYSEFRMIVGNLSGVEIEVLSNPGQVSHEPVLRLVREKIGPLVSSMRYYRFASFKHAPHAASK